MNVLIVGHAYIVPINRAKWEVLARQYCDVTITVVVPKVWQDVLFELRAEDKESRVDGRCTFIALDTYGGGNEVRYVYSLRQLAQVIRGCAPDIVQVEQGLTALSYLQTMLLTKWYWPRARILFFTWINWKQRWTWKYWFCWYWVELLNSCLSDAAIVGNHEAKKVLLERGLKRPIQVLPQLGVDLDFFYPPKAARRNIVLFIGRLVEEKGVLGLYEAFTSIITRHKEQFNSWQLWYVGSGHDEQKLRMLVEADGRSDRVLVKPSVSHEQVAELLRGVALLVLPSYDTMGWKEQFGHVLIEAMATETPVIGSDAGEISNVIGNAGLVFPQKNWRVLEEKLEQLMSDTKLQARYGRLGRDRVHERYSHQAIARLTYDYWNKLYQKKEVCG